MRMISMVIFFIYSDHNVGMENNEGQDLQLVGLSQEEQEVNFSFSHDLLRKEGQVVKFES